MLTTALTTIAMLATVSPACSLALHCHAVQGGIDTSVYSRHIQGIHSIRCSQNQRTGAQLAGSLAVLRDLELLALDQPMSAPINIMLAFKVDGHLLHLQFPVQLKLRDNNRRRSFYVSGLKGCATLIHGSTITGCYRWMPAAVNNTATGYEPGLLVINLSTKLQSCNLGAVTPSEPTCKQVRSAGGEGDPGSQQASELQLSAEGMQGEEVGREDAGGLSHEGGLGHISQQGKGQTLCSHPKSLRADTGPPAPAGEHEGGGHMGRGRPLPVGMMDESADGQGGTVLGAVLQRTDVINSDTATGAQAPNACRGQRRAQHIGPEVRCRVLLCMRLAPASFDLPNTQQLVVESYGIPALLRVSMPSKGHAAGFQAFLMLSRDSCVQSWHGCCLPQMAVDPAWYSGGSCLTPDITPRFSTAPMASHALLEALQLVQSGTPLSRDPGQVSPGHAPTRPEVRTWAAVELDGHLDSAAHQVVLTPTCAPGHYYYLKVG
jgi:hypothetical protein